MSNRLTAEDDSDRTIQPDVSYIASPGIGGPIHKDFMACL